jgi:tRNA pseudouridine55 synthase
MMRSTICPFILKNNWLKPNDGCGDIMNGIINIYKEQGYTSFDVVARLRGICHQKKIGHTGTLDPDAVGVLPVCIGNATALCDMLTDKTKEYEAVMMLGITTDTQDLSGTVLEEKDVNLSEADVISCVGKFTGDIMQVPPMYSAVKVGGRKLYELAREGKEIERKARPVIIHSIDISNVDLPRVTMRISCSKGTYIRTLCHDIGQALGCGACMESLIRTRSGQFEIKDAAKLSLVQQWADEGSLKEHILPVEAMFEDCPVVKVSPDEDKLLHNGNTLRIRTDGTVARCRVYDSQGVFYGVYDFDTKRKILKPYKMFLP